MEFNFAPFYVGQENGLGPFWYVGVTGCHNWLRPGIFAPLQQQPAEVTFEAIEKPEVLYVN